MSHYHYRIDNNLAEGKYALRHISCACVVFTDQLDHAWITGGKYSEQPRYASVDLFKYN